MPLPRLAPQPDPEAKCRRHPGLECARRTEPGTRVRPARGAARRGTLAPTPSALRRAAASSRVSAEGKGATCYARPPSPTPSCPTPSGRCRVTGRGKAEAGHWIKAGQFGLGPPGVLLPGSQHVPGKQLLTLNR